MWREWLTDWWAEWKRGVVVIPAFALTGLLGCIPGLLLMMALDRPVLDGGFAAWWDDPVFVIATVVFLPRAMAAVRDL